MAARMSAPPRCSRTQSRRGPSARARVRRAPSPPPMGALLHTIAKGFLVHHAKPLADKWGLSRRPAPEPRAFRDDVVPVHGSQSLQRPVALPAVPSEPPVQPLEGHDLDFRVLNDAFRIAPPVRHDAEVARPRDSLAFGVILPLEGTGRCLDAPEDEVRDFPRRRLRAEVEHPAVLARAPPRERIHELGPVPVDPTSRHAPATTRVPAGAPPPEAG